MVIKERRKKGRVGMQGGLGGQGGFGAQGVLGQGQGGVFGQQNKALRLGGTKKEIDPLVKMEMEKKKKKLEEQKKK